MNNRVLALDEVRALRPGAKVLVEFVSVVPYRTAQVIDTAEGIAVKDVAGNYMWPREDATAKNYGKYYRVWSLPVAPTADELAACPWPEPAANGIKGEVEA